MAVTLTAVVTDGARMGLYSDVNQTDFLDQSHRIDEDAVQQALHNLIRTRKGERVFHPEYGLDIDHLLFELITDDIAFAIRKEIRDAITRWEPRVKIVSIAVQDDRDNKVYRLALLYQIKGLEGRNFEYSDNLQAASGID